MNIKLMLVFIESLTFPLSNPTTFTETSSPSFTTSPTFATLFAASSEIWTKPSCFPKKFTKFQIP